MTTDPQLVVPVLAEVVDPKDLAPKRGPRPGSASARIAAQLAAEQQRRASGTVAAPIQRNWKSPEYKHPTAMRDALERARAAQPHLVALSGTAAKEYKNNGSN